MRRPVRLLPKPGDTFSTTLPAASLPAAGKKAAVLVAGGVERLAHLADILTVQHLAQPALIFAGIVQVAALQNAVQAC